MTEAQKRAKRKYDSAHYKKFTLMIPNEEYDDLKKYLEESGESMSGFIRRIVKENIQK